MKIKGRNPETGQEVQVEANSVDNDFLQAMIDFKMSDEEIKKSIDGLNISADAKKLLYTFSKATIQAGQFVIKIGRKIIDFVCFVYKENPSATFGVIFGAIAGFLIASIPIIGVVLGAVFTPIAIAIGLVGGVIQDLKDKELARKIELINAQFSPLNG